MNTSEEKKLSIICLSGDFDKVLAAFTLATGAAAVNYEVNLFFTFWGLNVLKQKKQRAFLGNTFLAKMFNFLMGGLKNLPLSRLNFMGISPILMTIMMKKNNVATLPELIQAAIDLEVNLYVCDMSMNILGMTKKDYIPEVKEVLGVAKFLEYSKDGETLFI